MFWELPPTSFTEHESRAWDKHCTLFLMLVASCLTLRPYQFDTLHISSVAKSHWNLFEVLVNVVDVTGKKIKMDMLIQTVVELGSCIVIVFLCVSVVCRWLISPVTWAIGCRRWTCWTWVAVLELCQNVQCWSVGRCWIHWMVNWYSTSGRLSVATHSTWNLSAAIQGECACLSLDQCYC